MDAAPPAAPPLVIRGAEPSDAPQVSALMGGTGTFEGLLQMPMMPVASRIDRIQAMDANGVRLVAASGDRIVGCAGLHGDGPSLRRSHVRSLGICVAPDWQGRGVGRRLMEALIDWADNWAHVLRIELHAHVDNERAIALYRSLGFVEEGRHRAYALKNGRYVDSVSMARLHPKPPALG